MRAFFAGFGYAARGIASAVGSERNLRFHLCFAVYVYLFSLFYGFSALQYLVLTIIVAGVIALELLNTAIERAVDVFCPENNPVAGKIKDISAGAVLVFCIGAVICGILMFWDVNVFLQILSYFNRRPWLWGVLAVSLCASGWFIFGFGRKKKNSE